MVCRRLGRQPTKRDRIRVAVDGFGDRRKDMLEDIAIIPGGGTALIRAAQKLEGVKPENEDEKLGIEIIRRAVEEPLRMIVENAGLEGSVVVNEVKNGKGDYGYNARAEKYENLFQSGVIDPAKVTRVALENAASIAGMLLTTECVLCDIKEPEPAAPANPGMGGMGGMY